MVRPSSIPLQACFHYLCIFFFFFSNQNAVALWLCKSLYMCASGKSGQTRENIVYMKQTTYVTPVTITSCCSNIFCGIYLFKCSSCNLNRVCKHKAHSHTLVHVSTFPHNPHIHAQNRSGHKMAKRA